MFKNKKILRRVALSILLICAVYLVYSIISNPFGEQHIMFALAVTAGFIALGSNKSGDKSK